MGMAETGGEDKARWQQLSGLLDEALALPPEERAAWLAQLPPQHAELIPSLKRMLAKESQGDNEFLARPVTLPKVLREIGEPADAQGNDIGPYRLIAELGSGGMGTVWIAERSDGSLKRQVALKLPVSQWAPNLIERMRRERDILASLEHPNIARLYDAGMTEEGRPYLALEYVEGKPIDVFCRERRLSVQDRLKLFLQVAKAVSHAHSRLVVHRDLKPNNILVMHNGDVRLLDFGIAKLLSDDEASAGKPTQLTRMAGRALTLDYASPEQIRAERITIASDVYSLGVVLFELLTGQRPYKLKRMSAGAIEDAIIEQEAPMASSVADEATAKILRGDLDVILAKALKKEVASRYASVESFAGDVSRYLAGQPVLAQPDSTWYRTRKFLRRNAGAVAAVTAVLLALSTGAGVAIWQARVAQTEAARAEEVKKFITSIFRNAETRSGSGGEVLAIDILSSAAIRIEKELAGNPGAAAELGVIVGESFGFLGKPDLGEKVVRFALEKAEETYGRHHIISVRAKVQLASIIKHKSPVEAEKMLDEVIAEARTLLPDAAEPLVDALSDKGFIASKRDAPDVAISSLKESVALSEKYLGIHSKTTIFHQGLLANTYGVFDKSEEQLANASEALKRAEVALGKKRPDIMLTAAERFYAGALRRWDRPAEALVILRRVLDDQRKLDTVDTGRVRYAMHEIGLALSASGQLAEAIEVQRKVVAMELVQNQYESGNRVIAGEPLLASLLAARRLGEASAERERLAALQARVGEPSTRFALIDSVRHATLLALRGEHAAAERMAMAVAAMTEDEFSVQRADAYRVAAMNARLQGRAEKAWKYIEGMQAQRHRKTVTKRLLSDLSAEAGAVAIELGRFDDAERAFADCRKYYEEAQVKLSARVATCVVGSARVMMRNNQPEPATKLLQALADDWKLVNPNSEWHGETLYWLAQAQAQMGHAREAGDTLVRARNLLSKSNLPLLRQLHNRPLT